MTTAEMVAEVQAGLGNRSDFTNPNPGYGRIFTWLNWSQYELCGFHKQRILSPRRFHCLEADVTFPSVVITQQVNQANPGDKTAVYIQNGSTVVDFYKGWIISITGYNGTAPVGMVGQKRVIRSYDGTPTFLAHVYPAWDITPDANAIITLYKRVYTLNGDLGLDPNLTIWTVERMEKLDDGTEIIQRPWVELVGQDPLTTETPSLFARRGSNIILDATPDQIYYFKAYYYLYPTKLASNALNVSPVFPEYWHQVIVEGALYMGYSKLMEPIRAAEKKQEWVDMAGNKQDEFTIEAKHEMRGAKMRFHR